MYRTEFRNKQNVGAGKLEEPKQQQLKTQGNMNN